MILLQTIKAVKYKPLKWNPEEQKNSSRGYTYLQFAFGEHPNNPEYGSVEILVRVLQGDFEDITDVLFVSNNTERGELVSLKKSRFGKYRIEVKFDTIYRHGLEYCARDFILENGLVIGLSSIDKDTISKVEGQRELLSLLAGYLIPSRKSDILNFARPALLCQLNRKNDETESHFLGPPKHQLENPLFHLATIDLSDVPNSVADISGVERLSFYLRATDTDIGWPEKQDDFKVLISEHLTDDTSASDDKIEAPRSFDFVEFLDLPRNDHTIFYHLDFSDGEQDQYDALLSVYLELVLGEEFDNEVNKLFGFPDSVQNCVTYEAERVFNRRDYGNDIIDDAVDWQLLLQVSPYCEWFKFFDQFGDGTIYFMIKKDDLKKGNFDSCQVIVQNT